MDETTRKPFWCKIGFHKWYLDSAWFTSAECCNRCGNYVNQQEAEALQYERALWAKVPKELDKFQGIAWVREELVKVGYLKVGW